MSSAAKWQDDPFVLLGFGLLVGSYYLWRWARREGSALGELDSLPLQRARSAAMGRCKVFGRVEALEALVVAPICGESCVWYRWERADIEQEEESEPNPFEGASSHHAFRLVDGAESIIIDPKNARAFRTSAGSRWFDAVIEPRTEAGKAMLGRHPANEWIIRPDDLMTVVGMLAPGRAGEPTRMHDASPETPLLFAVGWDRAQAWNDRISVTWARACAVALFAASLYLIFFAP